MFSKVIDQLKKLKTDAKTEIDKLESELSTLKAERDLTARLPVPKDEFLARVDALGEPSEKFEAQLHAILKPLQSPRVTQPVNPLGLTEKTEVQAGVILSHFAPERGAVSHYAVNHLLAPLLRESLRAHAENMPYPEEVGLPAAQRAARLNELDREAAELEGRIASLREELSAAGVRI